MKKLYWRLYIVILSLRWIPQVNLGDEVWYKGKKYVVHNGVRCGSWRLNELDNGDDGWVFRADCAKVFSVKNIIGGFLSGYRFYMANWFDIWCRTGILPWMRGCDIWPRWSDKTRGGK